jgi:hypothetical protein
VADVTLHDRIRRWWNPGKWLDEHPEISDGQGFALSEEDQLSQTVEEPHLLKGQGGMPSGDRSFGRSR